MNDDFFNQGIEKFSGQFCGIGVLLDESDPLFGIQSSLLLCGQFRLQAADFFLQLQLFCLVLFRQQIEVIFGDASADIGCPQDRIDEKELEQAVLTSIRTMAQLVRGAVQTKQRQSEKDARHNQSLDRQIKAHQNSIQMRNQEKMAAFEDMVSGKVSAEDYKYKREQCEKYVQRLEIKIKKLEEDKRQVKEEEFLADSIISYTNVRTLTRELVDMLIQKIIIFSSTSIEIVWKYGDEYQRLLSDTGKKEIAEHEQ